MCPLQLSQPDGGLCHDDRRTSMRRFIVKDVIMVISKTVRVATNSTYEEKYEWMDIFCGNMVMLVSILW